MTETVPLHSTHAFMAQTGTAPFMAWTGTAPFMPWTGTAPFMAQTGTAPFMAQTGTAPFYYLPKQIQGQQTYLNFRGHKGNSCQPQNHFYML